MASDRLWLLTFHSQLISLCFGFWFRHHGCWYRMKLTRLKYEWNWHMAQELWLVVLLIVWVKSRAHSLFSLLLVLCVPLHEWLVFNHIQCYKYLHKSWYRFAWNYYYYYFPQILFTNWMWKLCFRLSWSQGLLALKLFSYTRINMHIFMLRILGFSLI